MYSKKEIVEMIARQFNYRKSVIEHLIATMAVAPDEVIVKSFNKACGLSLNKIGSQYIIVF